MSPRRASVSAGERFSEAELRDLAGDAVFARGQAYARQGRVRLLSVSALTVRAEVAGSEVYAVHLEGAGDAIDGECDCPAFEDRGVCKHLVATALTVNAMPAAERAATADTSDRVRAYLAGLSHDTLVERLFAIGERDGDLWRVLELEAALASDDDGAVLTRFRMAIAAATSTEGGVDWRGAATWAAGLDEIVDQLQSLIDAGRSSLALAALDHLLSEGEEALEEIDDSDGEVYAVLERAIALHRTACVAAPQDPLALAADLFERQRASIFDLWTGAYERYNELLGPTGRAEFHRIARAAWDAGPDRDDRASLRSILDEIATIEGDVDARVALRAGELQTAHDYFAIAQLCLEAGREAEARTFAEEGTWTCEDRPDERLTLLTADLRRRAGACVEADTLLWAAFERRPSQALFRALREAASDPGEVVDRAAAVLAARIAREASRWSQLPAMLVRSLLEEGRPDQAWAAARAHDLAAHALESLARATEESHPREALAVYGKRIEELVGLVSNGGYVDACRLLARMERLRERLGLADDQGAHIADLALRHKAKRNFIRLLADRRAWADR